MGKPTSWGKKTEDEKFLGLSRENARGERGKDYAKKKPLTEKKETGRRKPDSVFMVF
jgi:hypothetical protein